MSDIDLVKNANFTDIDEFIKHLNEKGSNHNNYKLYTDYSRVSNILSTHALYLSNGKRWNDTVDRTQFNDENSEVVNYGLCLSFSKSENVAMWMLYSGNDGCMIDFPNALIREILNTNTIELGNFKDSIFCSKQSLLKEDFSISCFDILYYAETKHGESDEYYVKRSDKVNDRFKKAYVNKLTMQKKTLPWSYENECRVVVTINKNILLSDDCDVVKISFSEKHIDALKDRTYDSPNTKTKKFKDSFLKEKMQWNLCSSCGKGRHT